jgi:hypothetical protein
MYTKRGRAFRRWKTFVKYVSKIKDRMGWYVEDQNAPKGHRHPNNWKEMDNDESHDVKMLKKTSTRWSSKWEDCDDHIRIKKIRQNNKNIIDDELTKIEK